MPLQATLEEVVEADILIHVMDGSIAQMLQQRQAVLSILQQLGKSQFSCHSPSGMRCVLAKFDRACTIGSSHKRQQRWATRGRL